MRYSMLLSFIVAATVIGNVIDLISGTQDYTPNLPFVIGGILTLIALNIYMFKTPDRNFTPIRKIKQYLPKDVYEDLKRKGPFQ